MSLFSDAVAGRLLRPPRVRKVDAAAMIVLRLRYQLTIQVASGLNMGYEGVCDIWSSEQVIQLVFFVSMASYCIY